ncbi:hypothetical protein [uncultured Nocardioides sp.]|uniref:hypothetical protein n=1 Tax=uncultured Nocardioides sp. TaxID=198441 RepID=UPI002637E542|nr:hypothetical protein [uncultured Nocardioides sp.]
MAVEDGVVRRTDPGAGHALAGAYAVDAIATHDAGDASARGAFERHLARCPDCRDEVAGLREAAGLLAATCTTAPPPALRSEVLAQIRHVRPLPPLAEPGSDGGRRRPLRAAAVVVLAVALVVTLVLGLVLGLDVAGSG